jgi:hypothetical protein
MHQIVRSRNAMLLAAMGAATAVLGEVMGVIAFAILNLNSPGTFTDLGHAHDWLFFGGSLLVLGAVGLVTWERIAQNQGATHSSGPETIDLGGATVATLFIAIGALVSAASSGTTTGDTLTAVGIGLWGFLALTRAGRQNLSDRQASSSAGIGRLTAIWLGVAGGLILFAVGFGISFDPSSQGSSIASGIIAAIGVAIWAGAIVVARNHDLLASPHVPRVLAALGLAAASFVAEAIVAAIVFGSGGTVTELRIGGAIIEALLGLSIAVFGYTAWLRSVELPVLARRAASAGPVTPPPSPAPSPVASPADASTTPGSSPAFCSSCGGALSDGVRFCPSCGAQVPATH